MFPLPAFLLIESFVAITHANPLGPANGHPTALTQALPEPLPRSSNVSVSGPFIECDDQYGTVTNIRDCEIAIERIPPTTNQILYMDRDDPERISDSIPLPYRVMGRTSIATHLAFAIAARGIVV